jgi:hypothetical protein
MSFRTRVTEEPAAKAGRDYDLEWAERQSVGRPSLGGGISSRAIFRVDPETYAAVRP